MRRHHGICCTLIRIDGGRSAGSRIEDRTRVNSLRGWSCPGMNGDSCRDHFAQGRFVWSMELSECLEPTPGFVNSFPAQCRDLALPKPPCHLDAQSNAPTLHPPQQPIFFPPHGTDTGSITPRKGIISELKGGWTVPSALTPWVHGPAINPLSSPRLHHLWR